MGSNVASSHGDPREALTATYVTLQDHGFVIRRKSRIYRTPAFPPGIGPDFANAALAVGFEGSAQTLLETLHAIEDAAGRKRHARWAPRALDLDLLAMGQEILPSRAVLQSWIELSRDEQMKKTPGELILPHPRLHERAFVLVPLAEVAPDWRHPLLGLTVTQMADRLPPDEVNAIVPYE